MKKNYEFSKKEITEWYKTCVSIRTWALRDVRLYERHDSRYRTALYLLYRYEQHSFDTLMAIINHEYND